MRSNAVSRTLALLIANSFFVPGFVLAQQEPRKVVPPQPIQTGTQSKKPGTASGDGKTGTSPPPTGKWDVGDPSTITESSITEKDSPTVATMGGEEPVM